MAEVVRADMVRQDAQYPPDFTLTSDVTGQGRQQDLAGTAEVADCAVNAALNRSAEAVGRSLGIAVAEVMRFPRQVNRLRSRIYLVGESAASKAAELRGTAETKAANLRDAAEVGLLELADKASLYTSAAGGSGGSRMRRLRRVAFRRLDSARHELRRRITAVGRWQPEQPLRVILVGVSAGFALGVILRVRRSNRG